MILYAKTTSNLRKCLSVSTFPKKIGKHWNTLIDFYGVTDMKLDVRTKLPKLIYFTTTKILSVEAAEQ